MALSPQSPHRLAGRLLTLLVFAAVFGSACSATPSWVSVEMATEPDAPAPAAPAPDALAFVTDTVDDAADENGGVAMAEVESVQEEALPSDDFCTANANIWIHSAALNILGPNASAELTRIAMANVAEWIERSTLFDEPTGPGHREMFDAFTELQNDVASDFDYNWAAMQASSSYANSPAAQIYDDARAELVPFLDDKCVDLSMADLRADANARAAELSAEFGDEPSTVVDSASLPGHSIFTHTSGRLIASFPTAWNYEERAGSSIVDLVASPDVERFLANDAIDGVRLQLIETATLDEFRANIDATMIGSTCLRTVDLADSGTLRVNITQTFACTDHGASIIGQFNETSGVGLIIEASFDLADPSRADLIRLAAIANSALWS